MKYVYVLVMTSIYYDGDDYVLDEVNVETRVFSSFEAAKGMMEKSIGEEIENGNTCTLFRDGPMYARFSDELENGSERICYELEIKEREIEGVNK